MTDFSITPGTIKDLAAVMTVMRAAFDPRFGEAWTEAQLAGAIAMPGVALILAQASDVVGFALARTIVDECELMMIAVDPAHQSKGVGRALINAVAAEARTAGGAVLFLEVRDGNPAISLYSHSGFNSSGRRPRYYRGDSGETFDAITFRMML